MRTLPFSCAFFSFNCFAVVPDAEHIIHVDGQNILVKLVFLMVMNAILLERPPKIYPETIIQFLSNALFTQNILVLMVLYGTHKAILRNLLRMVEPSITIKSQQ